MEQTSAQRAGRIVVAVVVVLAIIVVVVHMSSKSSHHSATNTANSLTTSPTSGTTIAGNNTATVVTTPSNTTGVSTTAPTIPSTPTRVTNPSSSAPILVQQNPVAAATQFLEAFYLIQPTDTEATRRARVAPLVPAAVLAQLDFGLSSGTSADQARIAQKLTLRGQVAMNQLSSDPVNGNQSLMTVAVPVQITVTKPDGTPITNYAVQTSSTWQHSPSGQWVLTTLNGSGGAP